MASSSAGNSVFVSSGRTRVLIDAGLSKKQTLARLAAIGEEPDGIDAILITHEHSDHVSGLPALARGLRAPVYMTSLTAPAIAWNGAMPTVVEFQAGEALEIGDLFVQSFTVPHDAIDPIGFTISANGEKFGLATDLGYMPESVRWHLMDSNILLLESNHDLDMLKAGPYPWSVKQRVLSRKGHLSNDTACDFIREELPQSVQTLILGHLSESNNHPSIAEISARQALSARGASPRLTVALPRLQTEVFHL